MTETTEILNKQLAIAKQVLSSTGAGDYPIEFQLEIYRQVNKWLISNRIQKERTNNSNNSNGNHATSKQLDLLKKLGVDFKPTITKMEASKLIKQEIGDK